MNCKKLILDEIERLKESQEDLERTPERTGYKTMIKYCKDTIRQLYDRLEKF